jgi:hypothetical protein
MNVFQIDILALLAIKLLMPLPSFHMKDFNFALMEGQRQLNKKSRVMSKFVTNKTNLVPVKLDAMGSKISTKLTKTLLPYGI